MIGASCFILYVEVELLQVCGPLLMAIILQFSLSLHELQWLMISVDDCLLTKNVMLSTGRSLVQLNTFLCRKWGTCG